MVPEAERFVPKVHPATRPVEPEDPLTLHASAVAGDPELMLHCLVQEYARMGWEAAAILRLFQDPFYPALHALGCLFGEAGLRQRVATVLQQTGTWRLDAAVCEEPEPLAKQPELIQLGIRPYQPEVRKGDRHAAGL